MSSLAAKTRFNKLGGKSGTSVVTPPPGGFPDDTGLPVTVVDATTARIAAATDNNKIIEFTNAGAITYTIKLYSDVPLPIGAILYAVQGAAGQVTFVPSASVTFETPDTYKTRKQESVIAMKHVALNRWQAMGDLEIVIPATSVLGRDLNSTGAPAAIAATANGQSLIRRAGALGFYKINQDEINGLKVDFASLTTWTINHNFGRQVSVAPYTVGGLLIIAEVLNVSVNQAVVTFDVPTAGYAVVL